MYDLGKMNKIIPYKVVVLDRKPQDMVCTKNDFISSFLNKMEVKNEKEKTERAGNWRVHRPKAIGQSQARFQS